MRSTSPVRVTRSRPDEWQVEAGRLVAHSILDRKSRDQPTVYRDRKEEQDARWVEQAVLDEWEKKHMIDMLLPKKQLGR